MAVPRRIFDDRQAQRDSTTPGRLALSKREAADALGVSVDFLELRLKCCELGIWRDVLRDVHAKELQLADGDAPREEPGGRLRELSRLLREARAPWRADQPVQVVGATHLLAPLVRAAAAKAIERYVAAATAFLGEPAKVPPDRVRAALDAAGAWTATLLALHRVEQDGGVLGGEHGVAT